MHAYLQREFPLYVPRFNIAPSQQAPVIVSADGAPDARGTQWGLVPWWAKDQAIGNRMINARAETLTEKGAFKNLVDTRRCLVPASTSGGRKGSASSLMRFYPTTA